MPRRKMAGTSYKSLLMGKERNFLSATQLFRVYSKKNLKKGNLKATKTK